MSDFFDKKTGKRKDMKEFKVLKRKKSNVSPTHTQSPFHLIYAMRASPITM